MKGMKQKLRPFLIGIAILYVTILAGVFVSGDKSSQQDLLIAKTQNTQTNNNSDESYRAAALLRGQQLGKAFAQYAEAHDDTIPDLYHSQELLKPYLPAEPPVIKVPFIPLLNLSQKKRSSLSNTQKQVLFYEALDGTSDAQRVVGVVSGEVLIASPEQWKELQVASHLGTVPNVSHSTVGTPSTPVPESGSGLPPVAFFFSLIPLALICYFIVQLSTPTMPLSTENTQDTESTQDTQTVEQQKAA